MKHEQIIRAFNKLDLEKKGSLTEVLNSLKALGWKIECGFSIGSSCYEEVWEHPLVTENNKNRKGAAIMGSWFITLYRVMADIEPGLFADYRFCFGRIGNTTEWSITAPDEYVEEREGVKSQMTLAFD